MRKFVSGLMLISLIVACAGVKPQADWSASQYYKYAKKLFDDEDYYEAANEFTVVTLRYAGSSVADSAQYYLAESHFYMDEFLIAAAEFEKLINSMSRSPLVPMAQFRMAECYFELSPRPSLDQKYTLRAIREYQNFVEDYPTHKLKEEAEKKISILRNKLAEKKWISADIYRKMREYEAALIYFNQVLDEYYDTDWADDAMLGKIVTYMDEEKYEAAKQEIEKFQAQFPFSDLKNKAESYLDDIAEEQDNVEPKQ